MTNVLKISENVEDIKLNKCVLLKNLISADLCKFLSVQAEFDELEANKVNASQVVGSTELYDSTATKITNSIVLGKLRNILKLQSVYTTYGFYRKYYKYQELTKHVDRPECELSVSICLDMFDADKPWEILFENTEQNIIYSAKPQISDAVVYKGMELPHWREKCEQAWVKQVFLHFTFNKELEFDLKNKPNYELDKLTKTFIKLLTE